MDLEKLQQEAEALKYLNSSQMTPEQLNEFFDRLASILDKSEQSLISSTFIELQSQNNNDENQNNDGNG
jgi:hypothetical protein